MIGSNVDVVVAVSTTAALAARQENGTIPIVAIGMADPVADELVVSLARPGGNVTGTTFVGPELVAKRLQLLHEIVPGLSRVAALWHPNAYSKRTMAGVVNEIEVAARGLGIQLQLVPVLSPDDIAGAFTAVTRQRAEGLIVTPSPMLFSEYPRIANMAVRSRLPAMGAAREFVDFGGLMSYGANQLEVARQTAAYVDKILKGATPADLPVEQPSKYELVLNLKAAKALGLNIPASLLARTDEVIEQVGSSRRKRCPSMRPWPRAPDLLLVPPAGCVRAGSDRAALAIPGWVGLTDQVTSNSCLVQLLTAIIPTGHDIAEVSRIADRARHAVERNLCEKHKCRAHRPPSGALGPDHWDRSGTRHGSGSNL